LANGVMFVRVERISPPSLIIIQTTGVKKEYVKVVSRFKAR